MRGRLPPGATAADLDGFLGRHRGTLIAIVEQQLAKRSTPDLWSPTERTKANLAAMKLLASKAPAEMNAEDRRVLTTYSGWGGLSIAAVADRFPPGFPPRGSRAHPRVLHAHRHQRHGRDVSANRRPARRRSGSRRR